MPSFCRALLPCLVSCVAPLLAQQGDRRGEVQSPVPAHIKIPPAPVLTPLQEAATFTLAPGFRAELIASEPLIGDPIVIQFGPDGRLWVVEMRGYMPNVDGRGEEAPVGVIAVLTDTDADGRYDKREVFADQLVMPRALALVAGGVLVAEPTNLWFMRDTDGDGRADTKTEIANDYGTRSNPEHNANGLMWALDNWLYSAKHDVRFRWTGDAKFAREETIPRGQWGISQDDTGRIYYNSNSDPLRVDAIPSAYLARNPFFAASGTNVAVVSPRLRIWPNRVTPGVNRGYQTLNDEGKITSMTGAAGPVVYRGALFGPEYVGDGFVPEVTGNLVKRIKIEDKEAIPTGANAYEGTEFMASTDERFRPVNLYNGPDGALYVVDMYRGIIQHRVFLTTFLRKQIEERGLDKGIGLGRIWRIVPEGAPRARFDVGLARMSATELIAQLGDANGWVRDTAQRLLVEKREPAADAALRRAAVDAALTPLARVHALWTLEGRGGLDRPTLLRALEDKDSRVVAAAIRLSEPFLGASSSDAEFLARVAALVKTRAEPDVRLQLALTLGGVKQAVADQALRDLVIVAGNQRFLADAVVSGIAGRENALIELLLRDNRASANSGDVLRFATSAILKSGDAARIERVLGILAAEVTPDWAQIPMLAGVRHFLPKSPEGRALVGNLPAEPKPLIALAQRSGAPGALIAQQLLEQLKWPGKAGAAAAVVRPLNAAEQALFEKGKAQFAALCAACHQPSGQGLAGLAPSLVFSKWVLGDPRILARIVLNGKAQENSTMPPLKGVLDDEAVAGVLTFIRRSWGNEADPIAPAAVAEARRATAARTEPFSEADLQRLAQELGPAPR